MGTIIIIGQLLLSLSILVTLHEFGHYAAARIFGTRVEKFYLFFDFLFPFPDKWNFSLFKKKIGDTEYGIGWFPMGGYVKIAGMEDESKDDSFKGRPPRPDEFLAKPKWQRLIIMLGGVIVNFILGFFIFICLFKMWGTDHISTQQIQDKGFGYYATELGAELGIVDGDIIVAVGDKTVEMSEDLNLKRQIGLLDAKSITVVRNGAKIELPVKAGIEKVVLASENKEDELVGLRAPFVIDSILEARKADLEKAGIKKGDRIIGVNNTPVAYLSDFKKFNQTVSCTDVNLSILRGKDTIQTKYKLDENGNFGVSVRPLDKYYETTHRDYSWSAAVPAGIDKGKSFLADQFRAFGKMFKGKIKASDSLGGFGSIGKMFGTTWSWQRFWTMTGVLSLVLAVMNLLPIPMLDGGYVVFLLYEMITGREIPEKVMTVLQNIGLYLVLALMLFANGMDIIRGLTGGAEAVTPCL